MADDFSYEPQAIEVAVGEELTMVNRGSAFHDLKVEGQQDVLISEVRSGGEATVMVKLEPGTYTIYCTIGNHRALGMEGSLTVK